MNSQNQEVDFNYYFQQDILKLFYEFYDKKTFRFTEFVNIWNELKFYQIFS